MFYETAQTIGPGWHHRSYKPSHYEDMVWPPNSRRVRSPGSSPETYRRVINMDEDFPSRSKEHDDDFFSGRKSPTFPRRIFKEMWSDTPSNHRFPDRPRLFKRVFKPAHWDQDFDRDMPQMRRAEKHFDREFDDSPMSRNFEDDFEKRFNARDLKKDIEEEFQKAEGRVHHIPIMVEKRMEEMKSRFGRDSSPPERTHEEEYSEEWVGPQVSNLRKTFEPENSRIGRHRGVRVEENSRPRAFTNPVMDSWDPHAAHTLPTRRGHKNSQSFDDSRHPVPPKPVFRSYSETHEDLSRPQQQHSAAFRSHSDGHCPKQTYVTKIEVTLPPQKHQEESDKSDADESDCKPSTEQPEKEPPSTKTKSKLKSDSPSLQQISAILQNVDDLVKRVEAYTGTGRDKQFRFLDEMLTRCMLRLDDIDTEGHEDVRSARKAAVREVQDCIDKLEAKADEMERRNQLEKADSGIQEDASVTNDEESVSSNHVEDDASKEDAESKVDDEQTKL